MPRFLRRQLEDEGFVSSRKALLEASHDPEELRYLFERSKAASTLWRDAFALFNSPSEAEEKRQRRIQKMINHESREAIYGSRHETL